MMLGDTESVNGWNTAALHAHFIKKARLKKSRARTSPA